MQVHADFQWIQARSLAEVKSCGLEGVVAAAEASVAACVEARVRKV